MMAEAEAEVGTEAEVGATRVPEEGIAVLVRQMQAREAERPERLVEERAGLEVRDQVVKDQVVEVKAHQLAARALVQVQAAQVKAQAKAQAKAQVAAERARRLELPIRAAALRGREELSEPPAALSGHLQVA